MAKFRNRSSSAQINYRLPENFKMFGLNASTAMISPKNSFDRRNSIPAQSKGYTRAKNSTLINYKITGGAKPITYAKTFTGNRPPTDAHLKVQKFKDVARVSRFATRPEYDDDLEIKTPVHEDSFSKLRARAQLAKDHLCRHKILLDRYLPLHLGLETDVEQEVEIRYEELRSRMPLVQKSCKKDDECFTSVAPYKSASTNSKDKRPYETQHFSVKKSFTPKISETRKRARSVLCKVKGDPHYFDF